MKKHIDFNTEKSKTCKRWIWEKILQTNERQCLWKNKNQFQIHQQHFKYVAKTAFILEKIFDENFTAIHETKPVLMLHKPNYVGFTALELNQYLMHDNFIYFHYNFIKEKLDADLLFTDTGSLTYEIKLEDVYDNFFKDKHLSELNKYNSKLFDPTNKRIVDKMKDELKEIPINEFAGLKSKMCSIVIETNKELYKTKGVNISADFEEYKHILFNKKNSKTQS